MKYFLPMGLSFEQRESERQSINRFVRELNQIRKNNIDRDFANSYVVNNVSALSESYPFVSCFRHHKTSCCTKQFSFTSSSPLSLSFKGVSEISAQLDWTFADKLDWPDRHSKSKLHESTSRSPPLAHKPRHPQFDVAAVRLKHSSQRRTNTINLHKSDGNWRWRSNESITLASIDKLVLIIVHAPSHCYSYRWLPCLKRPLHSSWVSLVMKLYVMQ